MALNPDAQAPMPERIPPQEEIKTPHEGNFDVANPQKPEKEESISRQQKSTSTQDQDQEVKPENQPLEVAATPPAFNKQTDDEVKARHIEALLEKNTESTADMAKLSDEISALQED